MILDSANLTIITGLIYGGIFFFSCAGYGYLLVRLLRLREPYPLGALACIGIAVIIVFGGVIALGGLISATVNLVIVILGFLASIPLFNRLPDHFRSLSFRLRFESPLGIPILSLRFISAAIIIIHIFGSILPFWGTWNDDWATYFHFPKMMLETGSLLEPFNFRRMASLGGASYIQSFMYPIFSTSALAFTDNAIGMLLLWTVVYGFPDSGKEDAPGHLFRKEILALLAIMIAATIYRWNHFPIVLPMAMFFGFMAIAVRISHDPGKRSDLILLALTGASIVTYRNNFVAFVSLFSILAIFVAYRAKTWPDKWNAMLAFSFFYALFLLPWLALSYKSSGTIFFPVFKGNFTFPIVFRRPNSLDWQLIFLFKNLWYTSTLLLGALVCLGRKTRNAPILWAIFASVLVTVCATTYQMTSAGTVQISRYSQPFMVPSLLMVFGLTIGDVLRRNSKFSKLTLGLSCVLMSGLFAIPVSREKPIEPYKIMGDNLAALLNSAYLLTTPDLDFEKRLNQRESDFPGYVSAQNFLPGKAKVLSVTANPFYWNFEKQNINTLDSIGMVSPPPGQPFGRGPIAMARYFRELGYQYIVYSPFSKRESMYSQSKWQRHLKGDDWLLRKYAPYYLEFMSNINELKRYALIYKNEEISVIDLSLI
jgi:hypothetical protein